jgi:plasmid stabilization system protein ParE
MSNVEEIERAIEELSHDDLEKLAVWLERRRAEVEAEEDRIDLEAARRSLAEPGENIPLEKLAKELGLRVTA